MRRHSLLYKALFVWLAFLTTLSAQTTVAAVVSDADTRPVVPKVEASVQMPMPGKATLALVIPSGISQRCAAGLESGVACKFKWRPALLQSVRFLAIQHALNTPTYRGTLEGPFFRDWFRSVSSYRFTRWNDDDPFLVDYIGHPMMGAVTGRIQVQNDPRGVSLEFGKTKAYWKSRAKALAFSSVYAAQWELGPVSETSIGNIGSFLYYSDSAKHLTNGTGAIDLVMTPIGGTAWLVGEDMIDRYAITRLERVSQRKLWLLSISVLNPTRTAANLLRMKAPWHRDSRAVGGTR